MLKGEQTKRNLSCGISVLLALLKGSFSDLWGRQHLKNLAPSFENPCSESAQRNKDGEMWPRVLSAFIYLVYRSAIGLHWKDTE